MLKIISLKSTIKITDDGSSTLYVPELEEHYHSTNGAVQEWEHVFIEAGLHALSKKDICIFELGFGTGLNALLSLLQAKGKRIICHRKKPEKRVLYFVQLKILAGI